MDPFLAAWGPMFTAVAGAVLAWVVIRGKEIADKVPTQGNGSSKQRERFYRRSFESAPVGLAILTSQGNWMKANERMRKILGYSREELFARTLRELTHSDDRKTEATHVRRLMRHEIGSYSIEKRLLCKDGKFRPFEVSMVRFDEETGSQELWQCAVTPLRSHPPKEVADHSLKLGELLAPINDLAYIRFDDQGIIENWNDGAMRIFGYQRDEIIGRSRTTLYRDTDVWAQKPREDLKNAIKRGRFESDDARVGRDGVEIRLHITIIPDLAGDDVEGFIEFAREIDQARGVDQYRQSYERLKQITEERITSLQTELEETRRQAGEESEREASLKEELETTKKDAAKQMAELQILTDAFRKELERRRLLEGALKAAHEERDALGHRVIELEEAGPAIDRETIELAAVAQEGWIPLKRDAPAQILRRLEDERRTGSLIVESESVEKRIFFDNGRIYSCTSNDPSMFLGEVLLRDGVVSAEDHEKVLEVHVETDIPIGRILVLTGVLDAATLEMAMRRKAELEIMDLLSWTDGRALFVPGEPGSGQLVPITVNARAIVDEVEKAGIEVETASVSDRQPDPDATVPVGAVTAELTAGNDETPVADVAPVVADSEPPPSKKKRRRRRRKKKAPAPEPTGMFVASKSKRSKKFHLDSCLAVSNIQASSRVEFETREEAIALDLEPCTKCLG